MEARAAAALAAQTVQEVQQQLITQQDTAASELERVRAEAATSVRQAAEHSSLQLDSVRCTQMIRPSPCSAARASKGSYCYPSRYARR